MVSKIWPQRDVYDEIIFTKTREKFRFNIVSVCPKLHSLFRDFIIFVLFKIFRLLPLQNKVVATSFDGLKYADNPRFIVEALHKKDSSIKIVWLRNRNVDFEVPGYVKKVVYSNYIRSIYEFATAKVWISSHWLNINAQKRKGQFYIETWHGGLGIKKLGFEFNKGMQIPEERINHTNKIVDLYISNSKHLTNVYRNAFKYKGKILECGYPKTDFLLQNNEGLKQKIHEKYGLSSNVKILMYAPTLRENFQRLFANVCKIPFDAIIKILEIRFGGKWVVCLRLHPSTASALGSGYSTVHNVVDVTDYQDMTELVAVADAFVSDYSSCIFDAAIREIPCFIYADDYDRYKATRGVYYEMDELPFSFARTTEELIENIENYNQKMFLEKWYAFMRKVCLYENGCASNDIIALICNWVNGDH